MASLPSDQASSQSCVISCQQDPASLKDDWERLEAYGRCTPYQQFSWINGFLENIDTKSPHYFITVRTEETSRILAILPFTLRKQWGCKTLTWLGNKHFNYLGGLYDPQWLDALDEPSFKTLWARIKQQLPPFDVLKLNDQPASTPVGGERPSPFLWLDQTPSPNTSHQLIYPHHNWPELLISMRNKKTRKRMRNEESRLSREGELGWKTLTTEQEVDHFLPILLQQRLARLKELGIKAEDDQNKYFQLYRRQLTQSLAGKDNGMRMMVITLDKEMLAGIVFFSWRNSYYPLINSMTQSRFRSWSPGEYLLRLMMIQGCEEQITAVDYGPGEDKYKTAWCNHDTSLRETLIPETLTGRISIHLMLGSTQLKRHIKTSPTLWETYRKLRKWRSIKPALPNQST
ncbi:MAG: GNAT family N-acetyltransferase [bacterium]